MDGVASTTRPITSAGGQSSRYFSSEETDEFRKNFNRKSFRFSHRLAGHPLFEMPRLIQLAKTAAKHPKARPDEVYFDAGDVRVDQRWDQTPRPEYSAEEVLDRIQTSGAWMMIRRAELVDEYRIVLDDCMREIQNLLQLDLDSVMQVKNAIVFITSPGRVTTYHIDRECNFLLQVSGDKSISVFDKTDRVVLPEQEIERYWAVDNNAALYKPQFQDRACVYSLTPGQGVHIPVNAPHWVKNGTLPSVSLSVNFEFRARTRSDVYRTNFYLRRLGIRPAPPGQSEVKDALKRLVLPAIREVYLASHRAKKGLADVFGRGASERSNGVARRM
jgi:hypothetical protein